MNSSTKITLKSQSGRGSKYSLSKLNLIYQLGLKLALINGYDDKFRIRNKKGDFIPNSNLLDLMHNSMTANKNLAGMSEYVELLAEANADPEWFVNQMVKSNLKALLTSKPQSLSSILERETSPPIGTSPEIINEISNQLHLNEPSSPSPSETSTIINPITTGAYWGPEKVKEKKNRTLATYQKPSLPPPPPLKRAPISYTPPSSPPSPYKKDRPRLLPFSRMSREPPTLERMDVPPASPPREMPSLKRMRPIGDEDEEYGVNAKKSKSTDFRELVNKSMNWDLPDEDKDFD